LEGHIEVVRSLVEYGVDVNKKDADGRSTLYVLALENHLAMAKFFIDPGGADVESTDSEVSTVYFKLKTLLFNINKIALLLIKIYKSFKIII